MNIRESMEQRERELLSPYASHSADTRGREHPEEECDVRTTYQRDRDRILHCKAFRRMKDKTQVFLAPQGDHYRTRLTHTLEVSQIARVVEVLEKNGNGLNLTWEVRNGIMNHRTSGNPFTLEGQVVRFSDKIAYIHHDMDDAQRAGIITEDDIPVTMRTFLGYTTRERLNTFVHNIIENSMGKDSISMSPDVFEAMMELRALMFRNVYENPVARKEEDKVIQMLSELYGYYTDHPEAMSREYRELVEYRGVPKEQAVCDYISGMTDQYSMEKFREIYIPRAWEVY